MKMRGFTLIEIAVVIAILAVLLTIVAQPLAAQLEQRRIEETRRQLETVKEALYGYALANGRLPCPASATSAGVESPANAGATGTCTSNAGLLPAATLGLSPVDESGFLVDAWGGTSNRIRYIVSSLSSPTGTPGTCVNAAQSNVFTKTDGMRLATMPCLADTNSALDLIRICATTPVGAPGAATSCSNLLTSKAPFVVFSVGKNGAAAAPGTDESHNLDADMYVVSRSKSDSASPGGEFDDIVTWGSLNTLFSRMVQAGKLP